MAFFLKYPHAQEAIAVGRYVASKETMEMLCNWADRIVVMEPHMIKNVPDAHLTKVKIVDVGPDRYGIWIHPELIPQVREAATKLMSE